MSKFDYRGLTTQQRQRLVEDLAVVLVSLKTKKEMIQFLEQILTPSEAVMISRRLAVAERLVRGETYANIRDELGVGITTIRFVDQWLEQTAENYHGVRAQQRAGLRLLGHGTKKIKPRNSGDFKDYPGHFLLLNILLGPGK